MKKLNISLIKYFIVILIAGCNNYSDTSSQNISVNQTGISLQTENNDTLLKFVKSISVPDAYERIPVIANSFAEYLRNLSLKQKDNIVYLYNGKQKANQEAQYVILKIDVGNRDLQQCADAVMRLRAEYLYQQKKYDKIHFNFTSGDTAKYLKYAQGYRVSISNNKVFWNLSAKPDSSYKTFRKYLNLIFTYCGTYSLNKELIKVNNINDIKIGDVFIQTGNPYGHAIIVMDVAVNKNTNEKIYILAQSYMPAQEIHILKNPVNNNLSPWYSVKFEGDLETPEWTFKKQNLKRFVD
ncbi:MAG: DUF4846 domain-containing protein [Bacteroidales bacterium]|nr:DUF4846 domain-containing protein [Bacteroidales bacterium]